MAGENVRGSVEEAGQALPTDLVPFVAAVVERVGSGAVLVAGPAAGPLAAALAARGIDATPDGEADVSFQLAVWLDACATTAPATASDPIARLCGRAAAVLCIGRRIDGDLPGLAARFAAHGHFRDLEPVGEPSGAAALFRRGDGADAVEAYERALSPRRTSGDDLEELRLRNELAGERARALALERELGTVKGTTVWRLSAPVRSFLARHQSLVRVPRRAVALARWAATGRLRRELREERALARLARATVDGDDREAYAAWIDSYDTLDDADRAGIERLVAALGAGPRVSVLMPVCDPAERFLRDAIESVLAQAYERWELCVVDDASTAPHVRRVLDEAAASDTRVRVVYREDRGGISAATNDALALATGELVALLDHDDVLPPHALLLMVREFVERPGLGLVYSDEDKLDGDGRRFGHYFKPEWDRTLLLGQNYLCHFAMLRTEHVRTAGGFRSETDGSQDWDLFLRVTERLSDDEVAHVPHVLYHWRAHEGSVALDVASKPRALLAGGTAVAAHLRRVGWSGRVQAVDGGLQRVVFDLPARPPRVSVVIPSTLGAELADCLRGLLERTGYAALDVTVVAADSDAGRSPGRELEVLLRSDRVAVVTYPRMPFNYSWAINLGVRASSGDLVLLLNDDITVVHEDWLSVLVGHVLRDGVVAAGPLLLFPDGRIQHAGVVLGPDFVGGHLYWRRPHGIRGYQNRARLSQEVSCVTGACMLVRRDAYDRAGGLDESLAVAFNDVDLCLRLRREGRIVFTPDAVLTHHESASFGSHSRGREDRWRAEREIVRRRWRSTLANDPAQSPNLRLSPEHPERLASPPRVDYPWRRAG